MFFLFFLIKRKPNKKRRRKTPKLKHDKNRVNHQPERQKSLGIGKGKTLPLNLSVKLNSSWLGWLFIAGTIGVTVDSAAIARPMSTSGPVSREAFARTTMRVRVHNADETASAFRLKRQMLLLLLLIGLVILWMRLRGP